MRRLTPVSLLSLMAACVLAAGVAGCATTGASNPAGAVNPADTPLLRLSPASLGRTLRLEQQITVQYPSPQGEQTRDMLALLEADAAHTRLAAMAGNQVLARIDWDGHDLRVMRSPWAPPELKPERILSDMQLSLWPLAAIQAALPAGWRVDTADGVRQLRAGTEVVAEIRYPDAATTLFTQRRDGYRLTIRTLRDNGSAR
ncbi:DUF3261 domain-containing protein [Cupriavidus pauculus]|uniref:DUF3261 domain-containing protein n=1 Tax=Cupriavidus pauculus TaxID=82633 RepID=A0A2N5CA28_9BURK|nr:DUF3261 domain-containing protein [Cupriavidus pauculus]PLP99069.1 DUF3261 domain-containing protein [Cupriavidus pauculus]